MTDTPTAAEALADAIALIIAPSVDALTDEQQDLCDRLTEAVLKMTWEAWSDGHQIVHDAAMARAEKAEAERDALSKRLAEIYQEWRDAASALHNFKYPPDPAMLRSIADQIDCGAECQYASVEWDTNAGNCSQRDSMRPHNPVGCLGDAANELREFAKALETAAGDNR